MKAVTGDDIKDGLERAGARRGDTIFVHSSLRSFGRVAGGAGTVARAMVEAVGPEGTVVVPAFCFKHELEKEPVIDPGRDVSEMGAITEAVRKMPGAERSLAYRHSVAAVGKNAEWITGAPPEAPVFDMRGAFGRMLELDAKVLFLGTTYVTSTSHHFAEYLLEVPYRHTIPRDVKVRLPGGGLESRRMIDYQPKPAADGSYYSRSPDFNKLGRKLEEKSMVRITSIGNAVIRCFRMKDLVETAREEYRKDPDIFSFSEGQAGPTPLPDGESVWTEEKPDGAGRPGRSLSSVVDARKMYRKKE